MSRSPLQDFIATLPAFLRDVRDAEPIALALAEQAKATHEHADRLAEFTPLVESAVRTQADKLNEAAHDVREFAKRLSAATPTGEQR
jgi:hypothetical protein